MANKLPQLEKSELVEALPRACVDEQAAVEFLEAQRWGGSPCCPHCGSVAVYQMKDRETGARNRHWRWRCRDCKQQSTVRVGTIYEDSAVPLAKWCRAFWEASAAKNGISALELMRKIQVSYKTSLFMLHRIRHAMTPGPDAPKLDGIVEIDGTFVGGKPRTTPKRYERRMAKKAGNPIPWTTKVPVVAMVQRGGEVRGRVVAEVTSETLRQAIHDYIEPGTPMVTDERKAYKAICKAHGKHLSVNHSRGEYVNRANPMVHSNTIENYFSRLK